MDFIDIEARVEVIISAAHLDTWLGLEMRRGRKEEPIGILTYFGWTAAGVAGKNTTEEVVIHRLSVDDENLKESMTRIFNNDFPAIEGEGASLSQEARYAAEQLRESVRWREKEGKYAAGIPWKEGREGAAKVLNRVDSKSMAERRMWSLKRSMEKVPAKKEKAFSEMKKFIEKGRAEPLKEGKGDSEGTLPIWHLPCHIVYQKGKWRFCHDGRANAGGICLNEQVIGDLNLMVPMLNPLTNLRKNLYAFGTDIESFFHNILVDERDRDAFRFFWYEDEEMKRLVPYVFLAHIFGSSSSPTVTAYVLRHHAAKIREVYGEEVYKIINSFYVDDGAGGANSEEEYKKRKEQLTKAMEEGGFTLAKWKFSHPEAMGEEAHGEESREKILGVVWNMKEDTLSIAIEEEEFEKTAITPRQIVQMQAKIFDPLGIGAPFVLIGRRLTQKAMKGKWGWDIPVSKELQEEFNAWAKSVLSQTFAAGE